MLANAVLVAYDLPSMSFRSIDEVEYKKAIVITDETNNLEYLKLQYTEQFTKACTDYFI